jgi:hypothetical protein
MRVPHALAAVIALLRSDMLASVTRGAAHIFAETAPLLCVELRFWFLLPNFGWFGISDCTTVPVIFGYGGNSWPSRAVNTQVQRTTIADRESVAALRSPPARATGDKIATVTVRFGSKPAVISALASDPLCLSHPMLAARVSTSCSCLSAFRMPAARARG